MADLAARFSGSLPGGWIAEWMREDLHAGFVGWLDRLAPDLLVNDEIYGRDRITPTAPPKDLGVVSTDQVSREQSLWWNSESQSNWRDGWIAHCMSVGSEADRRAARTWVYGILETADPGGYLGIYAAEARWITDGENAELWAQSTLLRALLTYVRFTGDEHVLASVRDAVAATMRAFPRGGRNPFGTRASAGGVSHGLAFLDVLRDLERQGASEDLHDYGRWLFSAYAIAPVRERDIQPSRLLSDSPFVGHGVHTYEHWRALLFAAKDQADAPWPQLRSAYMHKLRAALTPSGGPNGDEQCHQDGDAERTGYEFCSIVELLHSYGVALEQESDDAGRADLGDAMESLVFNVGFGSRDPESHGIAYLRTDDSPFMRGTGGSEPTDSRDRRQTRYRYSPVHREAAVCCVPNAGRLLPTYLRFQWSVSEEAVDVNLLGPGTFAARVRSVDLEIEQKTDFPATTSVSLRVHTSGCLDLPIRVRVPSWADAVSVWDGAAEMRGRWLVLPGPWCGQDEVHVRFETAPRLVAVPASKASGRKYMVAFGPLFFAHEVPGRREIARTYETPPERSPAATPFVDVLVHGVGPAQTLALARGSRLRLERGRAASGKPQWWGMRIGVTARARSTDQWAEHLLVPMGAAALRQVTFAVATD